MVAETSFRDEEKTVPETGKLVVYLQKKKKNGKIIVSVTVNSVAPLQKKTSQWRTFGEMKLKIKKLKQKKTYDAHQKGRTGSEKTAPPFLL